MEIGYGSCFIKSASDFASRHGHTKGTKMKIVLTAGWVSQQTNLHNEEDQGRKIHHFVSQFQTSVDKSRHFGRQEEQYNFLECAIFVGTVDGIKHAQMAFLQEVLCLAAAIGHFPIHKCQKKNIVGLKQRSQGLGEWSTVLCSANCDHMTGRLICLYLSIHFLGEKYFCKGYDPSIPFV